jgi:hypothetical protein
MESLRSPERFRFRLTLIALALSLFFGWRLWTGNANPIVSLQPKQTIEAAAKTLVIPGVKFLESDRDTAKFQTKFQDSDIDIQLFSTAANLSEDHTRFWQKKGYSLTSINTFNNAQCDLLSQGNENFYRLSYYLGPDFQVPNYQSLSNYLVTHLNRNTLWITRIDIRQPSRCGVQSASLDRALQQYLSTLK